MKNKDIKLNGLLDSVDDPGLIKELKNKKEEYIALKAEAERISQEEGEESKKALEMQKKCRRGKTKL